MPRLTWFAVVLALVLLGGALGCGSDRKGAPTDAKTAAHMTYTDHAPMSSGRAAPKD